MNTISLIRNFYSERAKMINYEIFEIINISAFVVGLMFGAIGQKTQFCFSGSIKDYLLTSSTKRASSVVMAMIIAIGLSGFVSSYYGLDFTTSAYFRSNINYVAIIFGGILFGIGMMISDGCSSRHLIKSAQGDTHSFVTLLFIAIFAYGTTKGILSGLFLPIVNNQSLLALSQLVPNFQINIYLLLGILVVLLLFLLGGKIARITKLYDGMIIGSLVALMWYLTGVIGSESMERTIPFGSLAFVYPTATSLDIFMNYQLVELKHGAILVVGVFVGAFLMSWVNPKYSFGCTSNIKGSKLKYRMLGGALMGTGGVLALGCTVGQGLSGLSSLAFSSFLAIVSILTSGYLTALVLKKYEKLPMCFIFEWDDGK